MQKDNSYMSRLYSSLADIVSSPTRYITTAIFGAAMWLNQGQFNEAAAMQKFPEPPKKEEKKEPDETYKRCDKIAKEIVKRIKSRSKKLRYKTKIMEAEVLNGLLGPIRELEEKYAGSTPKARVKEIIEIETKKIIDKYSKYTTPEDAEKLKAGLADEKLKYNLLLDKMMEADTGIAKGTEEAKGITKKLQDLEPDYVKQLRENQKKLQTELRTVKKERDDLSNTNHTLNERLNQDKKEQGDIEAMRKKKNQFQRERIIAENEAKKYKTEKEDLEKKLDAANQRNQELAGYEQRLNELKPEHERISKELKDVKALYAQLEKKAKGKASEQELAAEKEKVKKLEEQKQAHEAEVDNLKTKIKTAETEKVGYQKRIANLEVSLDFSRLRIEGYKRLQQLAKDNTYEFPDFDLSFDMDKYGNIDPDSLVAAKPSSFFPSLRRFLDRTPWSPDPCDVDPKEGSELAKTKAQKGPASVIEEEQQETTEPLEEKLTKAQYLELRTLWKQVQINVNDYIDIVGVAQEIVTSRLKTVKDEEKLEVYRTLDADIKKSLAQTKDYRMQLKEIGLDIEAARP